MQQGEFFEVDLSVGKPQPAVFAQHPSCVSVMAAYRDKAGNDIVHVHYYRLPDRSVIPGKRPDPKRLLEDGVMYHQEPKQRKFWGKVWFRIRDFPCRIAKRYDALVGT